MVYLVFDGTSHFAIPAEDFDASEHEIIKCFKASEIDAAFDEADALNDC